MFTDSFIVTITEKLEAPKFVQKPVNKDVKEGAKVKFDAIVKGKPLPEITWYKNEIKLEPTERFQIITKEVNFWFAIWKSTYLG